MSVPGPLLAALLLCLSDGLQANPVADSKAGALRALLQQDCGACHGMTLKGGLGPPLVPEALINKPDAVLVDTILNGRSGTAMPPWRTMITLDDAQWLVSYLRQSHE